MAAQKPSDKLKPYEAKYKEQRSQFWQGVNKELDRLQQTYGVAVTELAEGLGISRQKIYDFRAAPEKGLPIDRTDLIVLWEWLTNPEALEEKRLSAETKKKREVLRQEGPNSLLKATGFLPTSGDATPANNSTTLKMDSSLRRVEARLSSPWIENGIRRAQIIDSILDEVKSQGRLDKTFHTQPIRAVEALEWLQGDPLHVTDSKLTHEYQKKIRGLARSGKNEFVGVELFELYQNLLEYHSIDNYSGSKVDIVDCRFYILSAPLPKSVQSEFEVFIPVYQQAERALLKLLCDLDDFDLNQPDATLASRDLFTPVVRASITSQFEGSQKPVVWRYSSTGTHLENMLSAITGGLGHSLEITGFSIQATGVTSRSLARVSIGLAERDQDGNISRVYQGWWVDSNAITAVLVATVIATKDWLSSHGADLSKYFSICNQLGDIDDKLYLIRENVQEYFFRVTYGPSENSKTLDNDSLLDEIELRISDLEEVLFSEKNQDQPLYKNRHQALKNRLLKTQLTRIRLSLKNSEVGKVSSNLDEAESFIEAYEDANLLEADDKSEEDAYRHILFLNASECIMLQNFYAGNRAFLTGKLWRYRTRYRLEDGLKKLGKYLKAVGSLDFEALAWASQMFGAIGLLELYMAQDKDVEFLQSAAEHLLWAAHYSQRIGYIRRATYWLTHASRIYCRLGNLEESFRLSRVVKVTADSVHQTYEEESEYDSKFKLFIVATIDLAEGERSLVRGEHQSAIASFLKALTTFVNIHSTNRLTADALYGLYRASRETEGDIGDAFAKLSGKDKETQVEKGMFAVLQTIIYELKELDPQTAWQSASPQFKDLAKRIWHHWATGDTENHPIEETMDRDRFLSPVKPA
ncbi:MAG: hypothetical protein AAFQ89_02760 [Cyanobacteria bacterium J06626_18]